MADLPAVLSCQVIDCEFWGEGDHCHASTIWVGGDHPSCDTYQRSEHHEFLADRASVRQCDVESCSFNAQTSCHAPGIDVGWHSGHADCGTYTTG